MMKKFIIMLVCMLACFALFAVCTSQKENDNQDTSLDNSIEIDSADAEIDAEQKSDSEENSNEFSLPGGFTYSFKDPENSDNIVVTPRE